MQSKEIGKEKSSFPDGYNPDKNYIQKEFKGTNTL